MDPAYHIESRDTGTGVASEYEKHLIGNDRLQRRSPAKKSKAFVIITATLVLFIIILAVSLGVVFGVLKTSNKSSTSTAANSNSNSPSSSNNPSTPSNSSSSQGSPSTQPQSNIRFNNPFGGNFTTKPFDDSAAPQNFIPPLNQRFQYGITPIRGVNIGGWLVLEPFITPEYFQPYNGDIIDEWGLCQKLGLAAATDLLTKHYSTFITEQDFADIASAGLNHVRIPFGYWAIGLIGNEPYVPRISWDYLLKGINWARKYGLRVLLDLHAIPGSQNGWNHSGKQGEINFLIGDSGVLNAQRTLNIIAEVAAFFSTPSYSNVVTIFGMVNEPFYEKIGKAPLRSFYQQAYKVARNATGVNTGHEPYLAIHDGFQSMANWEDFLRGADRFALDDHPYIVFGGELTTPFAQHALTPCKIWAPNMKDSLANFGLSFAGEMSGAQTDCATYLGGVGTPAVWEGSCPTCTCKTINSWWQWDDTMKSQTRTWIAVQMESLVNYFYWTWKTGNDTTTGHAAAPEWSYSLGLANGWISPDPRNATGSCAALAKSLGQASPDISAPPPLSPKYTGSQGGQLTAPNTYPWPPAGLGGLAVPQGNMFTSTLTGPTATSPASTK